MTTFRLPGWPWRIVQTLAEGRDIKLWLVGGAVRDLQMGRPVHDWDFAVDSHAPRLARAVGDALGGYFFMLDEARGTARVVVDTIGDSRAELDFAQLRGPNLQADLADRDFTINAMAVGEEHQLIDPLHGQSDLLADRIRATHGQAFRDDPVRLLRAARLEAELGFTTEAATEAWIRRDAPYLTESAVERLRDEFARGLALTGAFRFVRRLDDLGLLIHLLPDTLSLKRVSQSHPHRFDVWHHTLRVVETLEGVVAAATGRTLPKGTDALADVPTFGWDELAQRLEPFAMAIQQHLAVDIGDRRDRLLVLKLAALLHDVGKPTTCSVDGSGRIRFRGHESVGARRAAAWMRALRFSREEVRRVRTITQAHLRPAHLARTGGVTRRAIYRFFRDTGNAGIDVVLLGLADHLATWGSDLRGVRWRARLDVADNLLDHYFERRQQAVDPELPVDGHDLMRLLELEPGPEIGRLLDLLREAVAAGEVETREQMLDLAKKSTGQKGQPSD